MPHDEIYRELEACRVSGEFVAYHKWGDDPSIFLVGVVRKLTPTKATFQNVDPRGRFEAEPHAVSLRLVHTVDRGTAYLWRLRTLHEIESVESGVEREARTRAGVRALLSAAAQDASIVRIWTAAHEANDALVLALGEETVTVASVLDGGPADGRSVIRLRRIVRVRRGPAEDDDTRVHRHGLANGFPAP